MNKKSHIIFLHGWSGRVKTWQKQEDYFKSKGYEVSSIKMPGFDLADPSPEWGIPEYAKYVVDNLPNKRKEYVFVGHSFGGRVSTYIACHYSNLVEKIVLTDSAGLNIEKHPARSLVIMLSQYAEKMENFFPMISKIRSAVRDIIGSKNFKDASPVMREVMKKVVNLDLQDCLPKITQKTLIVWGSLDKVTPPAMAEAFHSGIRGSKLVYVDGAGHAPHNTHPEQWNNIVLEFLES